MKTKLILLTCLILTFLSACQSLIPTPTATPTATLTNTPSPTATLTPTSTSTPIPTATKELTLEEKFGHLVPKDELAINIIENPQYETFTSDRMVPPGTRFVDMRFRATGESKTEQTPLGKVVMVHLVFRDTSGTLQDLWMLYAGYSFGINKDGTSFMGISSGHGGSSGKVGKPEELLDLFCSGSQINALIAWKKGTRESVDEECYPDYFGVCNELQQESYRRITPDSEELKLLSEGNGVALNDFRLVPWSFSVLPGAVTEWTDGPRWEFNAGKNDGCTEGWAEGWEAWNEITFKQLDQGYLYAQSTGNDPFMASPSFFIDAKDYPSIEIRMKVSAGNTAQLFFRTISDAYVVSDFDEAKSLRFPIIGDGQFHTYTLDLSKISSWSGTIYQLRLDPAETRATIEIDYIRLKGT